MAEKQITQSFQYSPQHAISDDDIENCFDVMQELRPHLKQETFLQTIRHMKEEGYQLAFIKDKGEIVSIAGYWISTSLSKGKHLYVNDLVTANKFRSKGYGEALIDWLQERANDTNCSSYCLDSGTHRGQAHKFYFQQGFTIASYHFSKTLKTP